MYVFVHSVLWMWGQENLQWLVLFFHHMCLDQTLVIRPDSQRPFHWPRRYLYYLNCLECPEPLPFFLKIYFSFVFVYARIHAFKYRLTSM